MDDATFSGDILFGNTYSYRKDTHEFVVGYVCGHYYVFTLSTSLQGNAGELSRKISEYAFVPTNVFHVYISSTQCCESPA